MGKGRPLGVEGLYFLRNPKAGPHRGGGAGAEDEQKKRQLWKETGNWPWWIESRNETTHWSPKEVGADVQGSGCDGLWWRLARRSWLGETWPGAPDGPQERQDQLHEYEKPWVEAHGEDAQANALMNTEAAFQDAVRAGITSESKWEGEQEERRRLEEQAAQEAADREEEEQDGGGKGGKGETGGKGGKGGRGGKGRRGWWEWRPNSWGPYGKKDRKLRW